MLKIILSILWALNIAGLSRINYLYLIVFTLMLFMSNGVTFLMKQKMAENEIEKIEKLVDDKNDVQGFIALIICSIYKRFMLS